MAALNRRQLLLLLLLRRGNEQYHNKRTARFWVREIYKRRKTKGEYHTLIKETVLFDNEYFFKMFRMSPTKFQTLLEWVSPHIRKKDFRRESIQPDERLSVCLRYLVTGDAFSTIAASYRISESSIGRIVKETCGVIWNVLMAKGYLKAPELSEEWLEIAIAFEEKWNFPNCVGAIDGKHVNIQCPPRGGSLYFNYKKFFSIVLMAVVNANYEFILLDIGDYGRLSDGSVFGSCDIGYAIKSDQFDLPHPRKLPGSDKNFPYVFVGDDAFPLRSNLMKPYSRTAIQEKEKVANYRISRARRIVENAFGIATSRFRVFRRPINAGVETAEQVTKAVCAIHNFLMHDRSHENYSNYCPPNFVDSNENGVPRDGQWRHENNNQGLENINHMGTSNNYTNNAKTVRDDFRDYFCSKAGEVPWQWDVVRSTREAFDEQ